MGKVSPIQYSPFFNFDGGLDEYHNPIELEGNKLRYAKDIFIDGGKLKYRPGRDIWTNTFTHGFDGVFEYIDESGNERLLASVNGTVYEITSGVNTARVTGLTQEKMHFTQYKGKCFINGATTQKKLDGTTSSDVGLAAPASAPTAAAAAGSLTGSYVWKITYVIESGGIEEYESNPSAVSNTLVLSSQGATITPPASPDPRVNARYIYRTTAGGNRYYYEGKISNNTPGATFASGSVSDTSLVYNDELETNHGQPEQMPLCEGASNRLFWLEDNYLRWSEIAETDAHIEYQRSVNFVKLQHVGKGTGLKRLYNKNTGKDDLYIFQEKSISVLPEADPNIPLYSLSSTVGCTQHDTIREYDDTLVFLSSQKTVMMLTGGRIIDISTRSVVTSLTNSITDSTNCSAEVIFDHYYAICIRDDATKLYGTKVLVCDLRAVREVEKGYANAKWFPWDINCEYLLQRKNGAVIAFDSSLKRMYTMDKNKKDDDNTDSTTTDIVPEWWTGTWQGNSPFVMKRPLVITAIGVQDNDMKVIPYKSDKATDQTTIESEGTKFIMGVSVMGDRISESPNIKPAPISRICAGTGLSFKFIKESADVLFNIVGFQFTYQTFDRMR